MSNAGLNCIYIQRNIEKNTKKVIDGFNLASSNGQITMAGSQSTEEAVALLKNKILLKEAVMKLSWLHYKTINY